MENKIKLRKDNIIKIAYRGDQTKEKVNKISSEILKYSENLREKGEKVRIIISLKQIQSAPAESRTAASETLKMNVYDKIAVYGGNVFFKYLTRLVVIATKKQDVVRYFDEKQEAEEWLKK